MAGSVDPTNGSNGKLTRVLPAPARRSTDDPKSSFQDQRVIDRQHAELLNEMAAVLRRRDLEGGGGNGGGRRDTVVTATMVSLVIGVVLFAVQWFGVLQGQIDRSMVPLVARVEALERRFEINDFVPDDRRQRMEDQLDKTDADHDRKLEVLQGRLRSVESAVVLAQAARDNSKDNEERLTALIGTIADLQRRINALEDRFQWRSSPNPGSP